ncbi:MAG: alpha/beta hydrolase [Pseudomonadota bacterium]
MRRRALILGGAGAALVAGCAAPETLRRESNFRGDYRGLSHADEIVFLIPGALASTYMFGPAFTWKSRRRVVMEYRFPGYDGLAHDRAVHIQGDAAKIAALANRFPRARVRVLGFSTGGAIAIEAAARMDHADVQVAAIGCAVPFPGMLGVGPRGFAGLVRAAGVTGLSDIKAIWLEYFKTLLYGRNWADDPWTRARANAFVRALEDQIAVPSDGVGRSHSANLLIWSLSDDARASRARVRFYHGVNDTIVPLRLVRRLATLVGGEVTAFSPDAHLLLLTRPEVITRAGRDMGINR